MNVKTTYSPRSERRISHADILFNGAGLIEWPHKEEKDSKKSSPTGNTP